MSVYLEKKPTRKDMRIERPEILKTMLGLTGDDTWSNEWKSTFGNIDREFEANCRAAVELLYAPDSYAYYSKEWQDRAWLRVCGTGNIIALDDLWEIFVELIAEKKEEDSKGTYVTPVKRFKAMLRL